MRRRGSQRLPLREELDLVDVRPEAGRQLTGAVGAGTVAVAPPRRVRRSRTVGVAGSRPTLASSLGSRRGRRAPRRRWPSARACTSPSAARSSCGRPRNRARPRPRVPPADARRRWPRSPPGPTSRGRRSGCVQRSEMPSAGCGARAPARSTIVAVRSGVITGSKRRRTARRGRRRGAAPAGPARTAASCRAASVLAEEVAVVGREHQHRVGPARPPPGGCRRAAPTSRSSTKSDSAR